MLLHTMCLPCSSIISSSSRNFSCPCLIRQQHGSTRLQEAGGTKTKRIEVKVLNRVSEQNEVFLFARVDALFHQFFCRAVTHSALDFVPADKDSRRKASARRRADNKVQFGFAKELFPFLFLHLLHRQPRISLTALPPFASGLADLHEALEAGLQTFATQQEQGHDSRRTKMEKQQHVAA